MRGVTATEEKDSAIRVYFKVKKTGKTAKRQFTAKVKVVAPKPAVTELIGVTQTKANTFELTFSQEVQTPGAIVITKDENQSNIDVKSVTPVKTDATKLTVETFVGLTDGKEYTFKYTTSTEDKTVSSQKLVATDAVVASIAATPLNVTVNKATDISYQLLDKNGIVIEEKKFADKSSNIDITTVESDGYFNGSALLLLSEGATSKITIVYHSGKYDSEGTEATVKNDAIVITAVKDATTIAGYDYTIINSASRSNANFKKAVHQIAMEDTGMYAHFIIRNSKDEDVTKDVAYDLYKVESSDDAVLVVDNDYVKNAVKLYPVKEGTAYLIIKDGDKTVESLKVTVEKKRTLASFDLSKTSVTVATTTAVNVAKDVIEIKNVKDQYQNDLTLASGDWSQPVLKTAPSGVVVDGYTKVSASLNTTTKKITISTNNDAAPGTYQFVVEGKFGDVKKAKAFSVNVKRVVGDETYTIVMTDGSADGTNVASTFSTTIGKDADNAKQIVANLAVVKNGVVYNTATLTDTVSLASIQIIDPKGKKQLNTGAAVKATDVASNSAIYTETGCVVDPKTSVITMQAITKDGSNKLTKNMMPGTWTIIYTLRNASGKLIPVSKSFVVEDKQNPITAEIKNQTMESGDAKTEFGSEKNIVFKNGAASILTTNGTADWTVETVKAKTTADNQKIFVESITISFKVDSSNTNALKVEVPVNKVFTTKAGSWSNINS